MDVDNQSDPQSLWSVLIEATGAALGVNAHMRSVAK